MEAFKRILAELQAHRALPALAGTSLAWLEREREMALESWSAKGLPSRRDENWKYTSVQEIADADIVDAIGADARALSELESVRERARLADGGSGANADSVSAELVFVNGRFIPQWSRLSSVPGLHILPLAAALRADTPAVQSALIGLRGVFGSSAHKGDESVFASLNTSLFRDAAVVVAEEGCVASAPVVLTFIHTGQERERTTAVFPRVIASFGRRSEVHLIENHIGADQSSYLSSGVTDLHLADGSRVSHVKLQREGDSGFHLGTTRSFLGRDSRLESLQISLGAKLSRQDLKVRLAAPGAEAVVDGLYVVRGAQHVDNHTSIEHAVGETTSEQLYKGILDDQSRAVFNGRVWIEKGAQRSHSSQLNNNLLLSPKAEVDTKPELEIYADDVKASHGATIGRLDPEQVFYFESRAIDATSAVAMLAEGFAQEMVFRRGSEAVRRMLRDSVRSAVNGLKAGL